MESFFGTLKDELDIDHGRVFASPEEAKTIIGEYIERFYNCERKCLELEDCLSADWKPSAGGTCQLSKVNKETTGLQRHRDHFYLHKVK